MLVISFYFLTAVVGLGDLDGACHFYEEGIRVFDEFLSISETDTGGTSDIDLGYVTRVVDSCEHGTREIFSRLRDLYA